MFGPQGIEWKMTKQSLLQKNGKMYDQLDIQLKNG